MINSPDAECTPSQCSLGSYLIADTYDAIQCNTMTSNRVYRKGLQKDVAVALKEIENGEGGRLTQSSH